MTEQRTATAGDTSKTTGKPRKFGLDHRSHHLVLGSLRIPLPKSKIPRMTVGVGLLFGGFLGFLPILGFWMLPLGLLVLSQDIAMVRRWRRRLAVRWGRRRSARKSS